MRAEKIVEAFLLRGEIDEGRPDMRKIDCGTKASVNVRGAWEQGEPGLPLKASAGCASSSRKASISGIVCVMVCAVKCSKVRLLDFDDLVSTSLLIEVTLKP